jgi:SPP1 family predicted phage head-tail adaptor
MYYDAGELDQRIVVKRDTLASDGMGGSTTTTTTVATLWSHVRPKRGREVGLHDKVEAPALYIFAIRYRSDLRDSDYITWNGADYNIRAILTRGGRKMFLEIEAERGVTQ